MRLNQRLEKLEKTNGPVQPLVISYIESEKTEVDAVAGWEAVNGLIGNPEPRGTTCIDKLFGFLNFELPE